MGKNQKRYYNREAVVISALQVEKHPLITPGPFSTPPLPRHPLSKKHSLITMTPPMSRFEAPTSRTNSPMPARPGSCASGSYSPRIGEVFRSSPKPHSSPKMKLRFCLYKTPTLSIFIDYHFSLSYFLTNHSIPFFVLCVSLFSFIFMVHLFFSLWFL